MLGEPGGLRSPCARSRALRRRGVRQIAFGGGTTLNVDIVAFEEVLSPTHVGRVQLTYTLIDERVVRLARAITVERPVAAATGDAAAGAMVAAVAAALVAAVDALADQTVTELRVESASRLPDGIARPPTARRYRRSAMVSPGSATSRPRAAARRLPPFSEIAARLRD